MTRLRLSLRQISHHSGLAYASLKRWLGRVRRGQPVVLPPGPKKWIPPDWDALYRDLLHLHHGRKRSRGAGPLHRKHHEGLSRRRLDQLVAAARRQHHQHRERQRRRLQWHRPNTAWALDDTWQPEAGVWIHSIRDLASRFQLEPLAAPALADGETIAAHLETLFRRHGAPLVLKRDNGSNLNHHAVNAVLARWRVIPLNSPPHYPPYNGAIENAQKDWSRILRQTHPKPDIYLREAAHTCCVRAAHDLNHRPRQSLGGRTPCTVFHEDPLRLPPRERQDALEKIAQRSLASASRCGQNPSQAWRHAVQTWLLMNDLISIHSPLICYPVF